MLLMQTTDSKKRIVLLDSFRCLAILFVMFYHFTYRWTSPHSPINLYPYENWYGNVFEYGLLGVSFFFIISGFVISFTLEGTESISAFFKNRFIRLFPPMLLCTVITFFAVHFLDKELLFPPLHKAKNFLPSLTFISPALLEKIFAVKFDWLNGSYWSLWVEIQFYIISSLIYYANKKRYFTNILIACLFITLVGRVLLNICGSNLLHVPVSDVTRKEILTWVDVFSIMVYSQFFALGVLFHKVYKERKLSGALSLLLGILTCLNAFVYAQSIAEYVVIGIMFILFCLMVYKPSAIQFLNNPLFIRIGVLSYTIYLIHEPIGILSIKHFGAYLGSLSPLAPWIMITLIILFAELSYRVYEKHSIRFLKKLLFKPTPVEKTRV